MLRRILSLLSLLFSLAVWTFAQGSRYQSEIFPSYQMQSNITYTVDGTSGTKQFDLYTGTGDHSTRRPLVLFIHGGGFKGGDKVSNFGTLVCGGLAKRGYVVASINYRVTSSIPDDPSHFEAMLRALQDAKAAVRFFRRYASTYGVDTSQIFATGSSAGSITALHLAYLDSTEVPGYVNWANVGGTFEGTSGNPGYPANIHGVVSNWGAIGDTSWMQPGDVPIFAVHGTTDVTVYYDQIPADGPFLYGSKFIFDRAQNIGLVSQLRPFFNTGHTLDNNTTKQDSAYREFSAWMYTILAHPGVGPAEQLGFDVQPSATMAGSVMTPAVTVQFQDSLGNLVTTETSPVTIAIANNAGPGGVLGGTLTVSAIGGVATFNDLTLDKFGTGYTLRAESGVLAADTSAAFNVISSGITGSITTAGSGNWSSTVPDAPWPGGILPTFADEVIIADGHTVTIDMDATCGSLKVGQGISGVLEFEAVAARTLQVTNDVVVRPGAFFQSNPAGTVTTHALTLGGNLLNNGTLDFSTNGNAAGASVTFTGPANATFSGTGGTTNIRTLTLNKGTSWNSILSLSPANFSVQGGTTDGAAMGFLTQNNGTLEIAGAFTMTARIYPSATFTIPATGGLWLNNPNFTLAGQAGNSTLNGMLRVSQGICNIGTNSSNKMSPASGATPLIIFEGGTTNISGMLRAGTSATVTLTISGGVINVTTVGNTGSGEPGLGFTSPANTVSISGGTINLVQRNRNSTATNRRDYNILGASISVTGGVLNVGTPATTTNFDFAIGGAMPSVIIDTTGTPKTARLSGPADIYGDLTIPAGTTFDANGKDGLSMVGNATYNGDIGNYGTILGITGSRIKFAGIHGQQVYDGTGTFGTAIAPFDGVTCNNQDGVRLSAPIVVNRLNLFQGVLSNAGNVTMGNGGASAATIQVGNSASVLAGSLDASPLFLMGSGGLTVIYAPSLSAAATGFEIPPSRSLNRLTLTNPLGLALSGGNLTVTDTLALGGGVLFAGSDTLSIGPVGGIARTSGHVSGNLRKPIGAGAAITATYEIGDSVVYAPATVTLGTVTQGGTLTARSVRGEHPQIATSGLNASRSVNRFVALGADGLAFDTARASFTYDAGDLDSGTVPAAFLVRKFDAPSTWSALTASNAGPTGVEALGITSFSDFAIGEIATYGVHVTVAGNGTVTRNPDKPVYAQGDSVTLTAQAGTGWHFKGWSGDTATAANPLLLVVLAERHVTATFAPDTFTVTAVAGAHGSIAPSGAVRVTYGSDQIFTMTPEEGYHVDSVWIDGIYAGHTSPDTVKNVTGDRSISVSFAINVYTITATASAGGQVSPPGATMVSHGGSQAYTIAADAGYQADSVVVDGVNLGPVGAHLFSNVTSDHAIASYFTPNSFSLEVTVVGSGSVVRDPDQTAYENGSSVTLTAVPLDHTWLFSGWSGDTAATANPLVLVVDAETHLTATFVPDPAYAMLYRSFSSDSIAEDKDNKGKAGKPVKRTPTRSEFRALIRCDSTNVTGLHIEFGASIDTTFPFTISRPVLSRTSTDGKLRKWDYVFAESLSPGDSVEFRGFGVTGKGQKVSKYSWFRSGVIAGRSRKEAELGNTLRLPMPNRVNALAELFAQGAFAATSGLPLALARTDSPKAYGWFVAPKYTDVLKTLRDKSGRHSGPARPLDHYESGKPILKLQKSLPPLKHNNRLLANLLALRVSIAASAMEKTPVGFGELVYDDGTGRSFNGLMVRQIDSLASVMLTARGYAAALPSRASFEASYGYARLDTVVARINGAFEGPLDTVEFSEKLALKGARTLGSVPYLRKAPDDVEFARIAPSEIGIEQLPSAFALLQNYPNPFNPETRITFELPEEAVVTVKIYNLLGQEVATLLDREAMQEGTQELEFQAGALSSGVYLCRLSAESIDPESGMRNTPQSRVMKMILLK